MPWAAEVVEEKMMISIRRVEIVEDIPVLDALALLESLIALLNVLNPILMMKRKMKIALKMELKTKWN
jgi:hypothetical protein